ncbi:carbon storage regulator [Legionella maceachernii]|uniref:Vir region protein n=1 Tax=Legionella maceachernii TaxID=466 RepID=A0A0W0VUG9_9GAMM|nr:carbon storage regulator [Legionella maceachernii]KTD23940.1 vir region protein [Legionella maceachernii]SKA18711.1 carbon storage regulator, CsrA [Legionella maceachernii]SUP04493.1 carbon storage regulator [Legionella maceachernii]
MLKLRRKKGEIIIINKGQIAIKLLSVKKYAVVLNIKATPVTDMNFRKDFVQFSQLLKIQRQGESLFFDQGQIEVKIISINLPKNSVEFGIKAPPKIDVDRLEIYLQKQAELTVKDSNVFQLKCLP